MKVHTRLSVDEVLAGLNNWLSRRFARLAELQAEFLAPMSLDDEEHLEIGEALRRKLRNIAVRYLAENECVDGCGLIFAQSALGTENGHLEWWVREDEQRFARYSFGVVPGADRYYDYEHHEWFVRAFHDGAPAIVGPYIDYLGVEAYVLTLTIPAEVNGIRVGAVGNDIQLADVEQALLPLMLRCDTDLVLLGSHRNVILSNSQAFLPGDFVPDTLERFRRVPVEPFTTGVLLLAADQRF